ncbi:MAG: cupin [Euryarchaeota archaeon RBG_13_31_8]|nr:MAG: cupin [Euryarchaeota archaeon RBG_13_31_8]
MTINPNVEKLINLVDYQKGTIVSKTIIDKKAGTVTIFAFDKNQSLSEHTAPFDALIIVVEGEVKVTISGRSFKLKKDDVIIMPANEPHAVNALTQMKMVLVMIHS